MQNPLVTRELLSAIRELSQKLEDKLKENKYYIALKKLDEIFPGPGGEAPVAYAW